MNDSSSIIIIDDTRRIVPLLSSVLINEKESFYMLLEIHYVAETRPPLTNVTADRRGVLDSSKPSSQQLRLSVEPLEPHVSFFGEMGVYSA